VSINLTLAREIAISCPPLRDFSKKPLRSSSSWMESSPRRWYVPCSSWLILKFFAAIYRFNENRIVLNAFKGRSAMCVPKQPISAYYLNTNPMLGPLRLNLEHKLKHIGRHAIGKTILLSQASETFGPIPCQDFDPDRIKTRDSCISTLSDHYELIGAPMRAK